MCMREVTTAVVFRNFFLVNTTLSINMEFGYEHISITVNVLAALYSTDSIYSFNVDCSGTTNIIEIAVGLNLSIT